MRIEAHEMYMQSMLERACQTLAPASTCMMNTADTLATSSQTVPNHLSEHTKEFTSSMSFPSLRDLYLNGFGDHFGDHHLEQKFG